MRPGAFIVIALVSVCLSGCGGAGSSHGGNKSAVDDVISAQIAAQDATQEMVDGGAAEQADGASEDYFEEYYEDPTEPDMLPSNSTAAAQGLSLNAPGVSLNAPGVSLNAPAANPVPLEDLPESDVDIDLTLMSSTMVYSEVLQMMIDPTPFEGKTVRMQGFYSYYHDDQTGNEYHACIVQDATACCAQGIEFVLKDPKAYPDPYGQTMDPEVITVSGVFTTYEEAGGKYCTLKDAVLE